MSISAEQGPALYLPAIKAWCKRLGYLSGLKILKERGAGVPLLIWNSGRRDFPRSIPVWGRPSKQRLWYDASERA